MRIIQRIFFWLCWPALHLYFFRSRRTRALVVYNGKALLVKGWWGRLFGDNMWALPGGGLHRDEPPATGLIRELAEELKLTVTSNQMHFLGTTKISEHGISYRGHFFFIKLDKPVDPKVHGREIVTAAWLDPRSQQLKSQLKTEVVKALELLGKA